MRTKILLPKKRLLEELWNVNPDIKKILREEESQKDGRDGLFRYLNRLERELFKVHSQKPLKHLHPIEKNNAKECIRVFKNIIRRENERLAGFSAFNALWRLSKNSDVLPDVGEGFLCEMIYLFKGISGKTEHSSEIFKKRVPSESRKTTRLRSEVLDGYSSWMNAAINKYGCGLKESAAQKRRMLKSHILEYFGASEKEWMNYRWHLKHIIQDRATLKALVKLEQDEEEGLAAAERYNLPFQITPYYLSLFNAGGRTDEDRTVRAQVIPSAGYCLAVEKARESGQDMDFMGEKSTSPVVCVTRRYPQIVILKPFDSCPQICVYCQRNWEIKGIQEAEITDAKIKKALKWIARNPNISEVLVTGGDPLTLDNKYIDWLMGEVAAIPHVERIRIGTRVPVTLPFRINEGFIRILKKYHEWGKREVCVVTHYEHSAEMTQESLEAVKKIKGAGVNVYNQQVFTYYNSRRFETCALRRVLKIAGVDPYYSFNTKGKEETADFRVPIARIEQERKEEARLLPGVVRTDEPVFNVPRLGKSHLRAWQEHEVVMLLADGSRVYRFYPWDARMLLSDAYIYRDTSIYGYLVRLHQDGEDVDEYKSIWYYF